MEQTEYRKIADMLLSGNVDNSRLAIMLLHGQNMTDGYELLQAMVSRLAELFGPRIMREHLYDTFEEYAMDESVHTIYYDSILLINVENKDCQHSNIWNDETNENETVSVDVNIYFYFSGNLIIRLCCEVIAADNDYRIQIYTMYYENKLIVCHHDVEVHYLGSKMFDIFIKKLSKAYGTADK